MNKSALQDIQQSLNAIRSEIERVDDETKWAALELMLGTSARVAELAKKMIKPKTKTKTVTRTISVPKTKIIKQPVQQTSKTSANDAVRTAIKPITPQNRYPINKAVNQRLENTHSYTVFNCI